jgi:hypothetical protein
MQQTLDITRPSAPLKTPTTRTKGKPTVQNTSLRTTSPTSCPCPYSPSAASNTLGPASEKYGFAGSAAPSTRKLSHVWNRGFAGALHASGCAHRSTLVAEEASSGWSSCVDDDGAESPEGGCEGSGVRKKPGLNVKSEVCGVGEGGELMCFVSAVGSV